MANTDTITKLSELSPPGYEQVVFLTPTLPTGPFMLDEDDTTDGLNGPFDAEDFETDPDTNIMFSIPVAGHREYLRVLMQDHNTIITVDSMGAIHTYKIVPVPDNSMPIEDDEPMPGTPDNPLVED